jgi:hypothetical protein
MADGHYPDKAHHPHDEDGPFFFPDNPQEHLARLAKALQRALDAAPDGPDKTVTFIVDVVHRNPGGVGQYKVRVG